MKVQDPGGEYNYIKASQNLTMYGLASNDGSIEDVFNRHGDDNGRTKIMIGKGIELERLVERDGVQASDQVPIQTM